MTDPTTTTAPLTTLAIDVFADVVCPWCYIGERRLERALAQRPGLRATRRWRPFQLQPDMPPAGLPWADFVERKFGGWARARPIFDRVASVGAGVGLTFHFDRVVNAPNTANAHRLILLAAERGDEWDVVHALFRAHFADGRDIGDPRVLAGVARERGLDEAEAREYLASDRNVEAVTQSQRAADELGVTGVPFFVFGGRYAVSGAQPEELLVSVIDRAV